MIGYPFKSCNESRLRPEESIGTVTAHGKRSIAIAKLPDQHKIISTDQQKPDQALDVARLDVLAFHSRPIGAPFSSA